MNIPDSQIAVTLFNLRDFCQTESDLDRTLDRLCEIGYKAVQVSAVPLPAEVIRKQLDKHELFCCATHENGQMLFADDLSPVIDRLQTLNCDFAALGAPAVEYRQDAAGVKELIRIFNKQGARLKEAGIQMGYHNHDFEFEKFPGLEKTMMDTFYDETDPSCVFAEIDMHWVTRGGGSPVYWINKVAGRMPVAHFKDCTMYQGAPRFCEIGEGNLDWKAIIEACRATNVRWYSIEQDQPFPGRDIFESVKISFNNLRAMGVK